MCTLVRRFWHSLQAVDALFILPSSGRPLAPAIGVLSPPPAPAPGGMDRGAMGRKGLPPSPIALEGPVGGWEEEGCRMEGKGEEREEPKRDHREAHGVRLATREGQATIVKRRVHAT